MKISYDFLWQLRNFLRKLQKKIKKSRVGGIFRVGRVTPIQFCLGLIAPSLVPSGWSWNKLVHKVFCNFSFVQIPSRRTIRKIRLYHYKSWILIKLRIPCFLMINNSPYTAGPKKSGTADFSTVQAKNVIFLTSLYKTSSVEENDAKIVKFGWVILNLCTLLEIQSFSNFAGFWGPMREEFCRDKQMKQSIRCPVKAHCSVFLLLPRINGLPQNTIMEGLSRHNSSLTGCKNRAKFENDCISRNGHSIKITEPNLMIYHLCTILFCGRCCI